MQKAVFKTKGKTWKKAIKNLGRLKGNTIEVGHFASQGTHYSGMTYPDLLRYWVIGVKIEGQGGRMRQDVLSQFIHMYLNSKQMSRDLRVESAIKRWLKTALHQDNSKKLLDDVGEILRDEYKTHFNKTAAPFMASGSSTPLFETGELADATAFRTSKNPSIKER